MHLVQEMPPLKQMVPSVNVEAIAAEVEKLLGQKSTSHHGSFLPSSSSSSQNAISSFLNSVVQLQQAVPGINVVQLLQAVGGSQNASSLDCSALNGMTGGGASAQMDLKAALAQAQMQLNLQNQVHNLQVCHPCLVTCTTLSFCPLYHFVQLAADAEVPIYVQAQAQVTNDFVRHPSWSSNRTLQSALSMDNSGPLSGPLNSFDNTFSPRAASLNAFSGQFSTRNSTSSASSLPAITTHNQVPSSSGLALSSSGLCNQHGRGDIPVDWATIDSEVTAGRIGSGGSDRSTTGADNPHEPDSGLWACEEWLAPQSNVDHRAGQLTAKSGMKCADDVHGLKCMDPLLDALPRDLTDMSGGIVNS
jgi:hypothetical protein